MKRHSIPRRVSRKKFRKTAGRVHKSNFYNPIKRGGTRL